ncbi:hypothetical protein QOT17_006771 [Balamuthia mandrillaris]
MLARQGSLLPWRAPLVCLQRTSVNKAWQTGCWSRSYVKAVDLRRGQAFRFRGSIWEIVEIGQSRNTAHGAAHVSATIKDLETGVRKIEHVLLEKGTFTYKGQEKDKLLFENLEEGITVSCPASKLGHHTTYLKGRAFWELSLNVPIVVSKEVQASFSCGPFHSIGVKPTYPGQVYDYLKCLQSFHGLAHPFAIVSTYQETVK